MTKRVRFDETTQRVHDYRHLIARWRRVAHAAGLKLEPFAQTGEYPVYALQTPDRSEGGLFISAGIHGDEPAGTEGLLRWAEAHLPTLVRRQRTLPLLILPCLNPWGLVNNRRSDKQGRDLNRIFRQKNVPMIAGLKKRLADCRFDLALCLHEDYDGRGNYVYEIHDRAPDWGQELLAHCAAAIPVDPRRTIEGLSFKGGVMLRRTQLENIPFDPEALHLYFHHTRHVLTFETPSEFALARRIQAHVLLIEECVRRLLSKVGRGRT